MQFGYHTPSEVHFSHMVNHPTQISILANLMYKQPQNFASLNTTGLTSDHFNFHLQKLVEIDLVTKFGSNYSLTSKGIEFAGRLDLENLSVKPQPKIGVGVFTFRQTSGGVEFLLHTRKKSQSQGLAGCLTEKISLNESVYQTVDRALANECGLTGIPIYVGANHHRSYRQRELEVDVVLLLFKVVDPEGDLVAETIEGINEWVNLKDLESREGKFISAELVESVWLGNAGFTETESLD